MDKLRLYKTTDLSKITKYRDGEVKFGEKMLVIPQNTNPFEYLKESEAKYVLFGIPEDIGVRANSETPGAGSSWKNAMKSIANIQHNRFCKGNQIIVLGDLNVDEEMEQAKNLDFDNKKDREKLFQLVSQIDKEVAHIVHKIVKAKKIPIIIGGGQNNAYGNIKGTALAYAKPINAINFDTRSDFRILEGRHCGNAFSYAYDEGFLKKYFIFGLHENNVSKNVLHLIKKMDTKIKYVTYDDIEIRKQKKIEHEMHEALEFIKDAFYGVEIDLNAIATHHNNANNLTGFSVTNLRQFICHFSQNKNVAYLHLSKGGSALNDKKSNKAIGKLISYFVTDFIKSHNLILNLQTHV